MKPPEKIKKGLECCETTIAEGRRTTCNAQCPYFNEGIFCRNVLHGDTESYIVQLELYFSQISRALCGKESATICEVLDAVSQLKSRLAQVERERDALKHDMRQCQSAVCNACKHHYRPNPDVRFYECALLGRFSDFLNSDDDRPFICGKFEWRGVCPENTKEDSK